MPIEDDSIPDSEIIAELIECLNCEARYSVLLGEDFLNDTAHYCPFCGEYIVGEE